MLVIDKTTFRLNHVLSIIFTFFSKFLLFHVVGPISTNISFNDIHVLTTCVITANILLWNALSLCGRLRNWFKSVHLSGHSNTYGISKNTVTQQRSTSINNSQAPMNLFIFFFYLPGTLFCESTSPKLGWKYCKRMLLNVIITATVCSANRWWVSSVSVSDSTSIYHPSRTWHFTFITL